MEMKNMSSNLAFTMNNSNTSAELCSHLDNPVSRNINIASAAICSVIFLLATVASSFVLYIKVYRMEMKYRSPIFRSLFLSGLISSLFLLLKIIYFAGDLHWPFGGFMCKLTNTVFHLNLFISAFSFALFSIDYCSVVLTPLKYNIYRFPQLAWREVLVLWIIAMSASIPYMVFTNTLECDGRVRCLDVFDDSMLSDIRRKRREAMVLMTFMLGYLIPYLIMLSCFVITGLVYHRKKTSKYTPALKMIFSMQAAFGLFSLPYHVVRLLKLSTSTSGESYLDEEIVQPITISLATLASCVSPIVYAFVCPEFVKACNLKSFFVKNNKALIV